MKELRRNGPNAFDVRFKSRQHHVILETLKMVLTAAMPALIIVKQYNPHLGLPDKGSYFYNSPYLHCPNEQFLKKNTYHTN